MNCPECFSTNAYVYDTRQFETYRWRRYECKDCGHRFTTKEMEASRIKVSDEKSGEWKTQLLSGRVVCVCSECDTIGSPLWKRCPICEAKMYKEADDGHS